VAVYPNPFTNMLKIQAKGKIRVTMFDLLGKILILQTGSDEVHIMRNELTPGVYLLQIDLDSKTIYKKVSIN
jgi:hypothetical protein